ncbi:hypothetical protein V2J09_004814 [Rumex salicifolius]
MDPDQLRYIHHKPLSITDINVRLALPVRLIDYIWGPNDPREREFRVTDRFGEGWDFRAHMRWDQHGHQKPEVYGSEWSRFVRIKELRAGDELFFYRHPDPDPAPAPSRVIFVLSIKRSIELLGNIVTGHIAI